MCIICVKNKGVEVPTKDVIANMFDNNPDGAGFAYCVNNTVHIRKGLMSLQAFNSALDAVYRRLGDKVLDTAFIYHFRITTSGGTRPQMCHPFPLSSDTGMLCKTRCVSDVAVAHNGMIDIGIDEGLSDTATYIKRELAPFKTVSDDFWKSDAVRDAIYHRIGSKLAILSSDGEIVTIGKFEEVDELLYSNDSYKPYSRFWGDDYAGTPVQLVKKPKGLMWRLHDNTNIDVAGSFQPLYNTPYRTIYVSPDTRQAYSVTKNACLSYGEVIDWYCFNDSVDDRYLENCTSEVVL